jgi:hypothetical protein
MQSMNRRHQNQSSIQENQQFPNLDEVLGCPSHGISVCGRVAKIRRENAHLEEELSRTKAEREIFRAGFVTLLSMVNKSLRKDFVIESFKQRLSEIPLIKSAYCLQRKNGFTFSIYMDKENWEIEDKIFDIYGDLLDTFPELDIKVRILRLWGRKEDEIYLFGGTKILG